MKADTLVSRDGFIGRASFSPDGRKVLLTGYPDAPYNPGFVYCHVTDTVVNDIFRGTGKTYKETVRQIYKTQKPASFHTGKCKHV